MPIDGKLLEILCCPVSKTPLTRLPSARLEKLNTAIGEGKVQTVHGEAVKQALNEALITVIISGSRIGSIISING